MIEVKLTETEVQALWSRLTEEEKERLKKKLSKENSAFNKRNSRREKKELYKKNIPIKRIELAEKFRVDLVAKQTTSEACMKAKLKMIGETYNFQKIIYTKQSFYLADFYIPERNLIIEIDGGYHTEKEQITKDKLRSTKLRELGFKNIRRFTNDYALSITPENLQKILSNYHKLKSTTLLPQQIQVEKGLNIEFVPKRKPDAIQLQKKHQNKQKKPKSKTFKFLTNKNSVS